MIISASTPDRDAIPARSRTSASSSYPPPIQIRDGETQFPVAPDQVAISYRERRELFGIEKRANVRVGRPGEERAEIDRPLPPIAEKEPQCLVFHVAGALDIHFRGDGHLILRVMRFDSIFLWSTK